MGIEEKICQMNVICREQPEVLIQTFQFTTGEELAADTFNLVDIDSDGYKDIEILDHDARNKQYKYYRWDPFEEKYESQPFSPYSATAIL
jgi:hypothetical protein